MKSYSNNLKELRKRKIYAKCQDCLRKAAASSAIRSGCL